MATWSSFAEQRPEMAAVLSELLARVPIAYLATIRRDGAPRVRPVCPIIAAGRMFVAVAGTRRAPPAAPSPKRWDLARDGRFALHALPGERDDEFYATGRAVRIFGASTRDAVRLAAGHEIRAEDWLFELGFSYVQTAYWERVGQPGTYAVRTEWREEPL